MKFRFLEKEKKKKGKEKYKIVLVEPLLIESDQEVKEQEEEDKWEKSYDFGSAENDSSKKSNRKYVSSPSDNDGMGKKSLRAKESWWLMKLKESRP